MAETRRAAIGPLENLPTLLRRAFEPGNDFEPLPPPKQNDWLASNPEPGQTFEEFLRARPHRPDGRRHTLYLQPVGAFGPGSPALDRLREFTALFFDLPVSLLPPLVPAAREVTVRRNPQSGHTQLLTADLLALLFRNLRGDAHALLGITMEDLYPDEEWSFVFGQASLRHRVGIYSFARYDPRFYGEGRSPGWEQLLFRRSCKVLAHEMTHLFGIQHCVFYRCLMNGSNHLAESDARPLHLCPVDLRKLHTSIGFEIVGWYRGLSEFYLAVGLEDEAAWLERRVKRIEGQDGVGLSIS